MLLLRGRLACADHRLRRHFEGQREFAGSRVRLAGCWTRSGEVGDLHAIACPGACGVAPAAFDDHALGLAGTRAHVQRAAGEYQGQGSGDLWVPGISGAAGGGHSDLQGGRGAGRRRSGGAHRVDAGGRATVQRILWRDEPVFPEPQSLLTPAPKLPGTDGRKMSKSYGNTIMMADPEPVVRQKLKTMVTDPARVRRSDPGNPDVCPVGDLHKIFSSKETMAKVNEGCRSAGIGCIECKGWASDALVQVLMPMQERRKKYEDNPRLAWDILEAGSAAASQVADATMRDVRASMGMSLEYEPPRKPDAGTSGDESSDE